MVVPDVYFQQSRGIAPLSDDNVPFEIDTLTFVGQLTVDGIVNPPPAGPRTNELPLADSVTNYPPA